MATFTIFFCGTGSNSFDFAHTSYFDGELISTLATHHEGNEFVDWIIVDGPGSGNLQEAQKWVPSGDYSAIRGTLTGRGWSENVQHAIAVLLGGTFTHRAEHTRTEKSVLRNHGVGVREVERSGRVARALLGDTKKVHDELHARITPQMLQQKRIEITRQPITEVNVIGWSRGGVTCHMFANALAQVEGWQRTPVNIFAVDPVPGAGNFQEERTTLGSNVAYYVALYAADERSKGFSPVIPFLHAKTKRWITTMPGRHGTLVGNAAIDGSKGVNTYFGPGRVTRDLAEKFLTAWGTPLAKRLRRSDDELLADYEEILSQTPGFRAMRNQSYTYFAQGAERTAGFGRDGREVDLTSVVQLHPDPVFVNTHHRWVFRERYPGLYRAIFGTRPGVGPELDRDGREVHRRYPLLWQHLPVRFVDPRRDRDADAPRAKARQGSASGRNPPR